MVIPTRDDIHSYMTITGASHSLTIQRLEEHGGNLTQAVNAHFRDVERSIVDPSLDTRSEYNVVEGNNNQVRDESRPGGLPSLLSAARAFRPSLLLDPNYRRNIFRQISGSGFSGHSPQSSHSGEVTRFPAHSTWENDQIRPPGRGDVGDGYARYPSSHGSQIYGVPHRNVESPLYNNDAEEEMIRAAIEASNKEFQEGHHNIGSNLNNDPSTVLLPTEVIQQENEDIARAISLSLEMEEKERELREQIAKLMPRPVAYHDTCETDANESSRIKHRSSSVQYRREDTKEKQPVDISSHHRHDSQSVEAPNPEEWGGIPSKEIQEAIMLEKALFNGMAVESASYDDLPGSHMGSQSSNNRIISEEPEKLSTANKASLPIEPLLENEDAITLLVRMPDSSRHGRRFLKSDKLKYLFDFIDAAGLVEPNSYRVVRPYPRRAFSLREGALTFEELSLTNKQEALFLELL